jgi:hypothetical protein
MSSKSYSEYNHSTKTDTLKDSFDKAKSFFELGQGFTMEGSPSLNSFTINIRKNNWDEYSFQTEETEEGYTVSLNYHISEFKE